MNKIDSLWQNKLIARNQFIKKYISDYEEEKDLFTLINGEILTFQANSLKKNKSHF